MEVVKKETWIEWISFNVMNFLWKSYVTVSSFFNQHQIVNGRVFSSRIWICFVISKSLFKWQISIISWRRCKISITKDIIKTTSISFLSPYQPQFIIWRRFFIHFRFTWESALKNRSKASSKPEKWLCCDNNAIAIYDYGLHVEFKKGKFKHLYRRLAARFFITREYKFLNFHHARQIGLFGFYDSAGTL